MNNTKSLPKRYRYILFMTCVILFISVFESSATIHAQNSLSIKMKNAPISAIIKDIESKTDFSFFYNSEQVNVTIQRTINVKDESIEKVLTQLLDGTGYAYELFDKQILIKTEGKNYIQPTAGQQSLLLKGRIVDENNEPLIGVNIQEVGTNNITVTDIEGNFSIYNIASQASVIRFTYIGYIPMEITVGKQDFVNIKMVPDAQGLEEVVVVGYGAQKRESVIGAISTVKPTTLQVNQTRSLTNGLAGQIAGVIAVQRSGEPGYDTSEFWIRGINTFGANANPLVLVDGVERSLNNISAEEIESFSILKDATATAVYGVRGANGVILIQTKKREAGETGYYCQI